MNYRIEKRIELNAPVARVWRALTDYREFGEWFRVKSDGPFEPGQVSRGHIAYPGYEHLKWEAVVQKMEPERLFSFTWHPYAVDPNVDYSPGNIVYGKSISGFTSAARLMLRKSPSTPTTSQGVRQ
jgi:uncharacterized protein YndB with AHSA1/START domain